MARKDSGYACLPVPDVYVGKTLGWVGMFGAGHGSGPTQTVECCMCVCVCISVFAYGCLSRKGERTFVGPMVAPLEQSMQQGARHHGVCVCMCACMGGG